MRNRATDPITQNDINIRDNLNDGEWASIRRRSRTPTPQRSRTPTPYSQQPPPRRNKLLYPLLAAGAVGAGGAAYLTRRYWYPALKKGLKHLAHYLPDTSKFNQTRSMYTQPPLPKYTPSANISIGK